MCSNVYIKLSEKCAPRSINRNEQEIIMDFYIKELGLDEKEAQQELWWLRRCCLCGIKKDVIHAEGIINDYGRYRV